MWSRRYVHFLDEALEAVPEEQRRLGLLIFLAILGHAAVFFFVHITATPAHGTARPKTAITLDTLTAPASSKQRSFTPAFANLSFWNRINDPSLVIFPPTLLQNAGSPSTTPQPIWPGDAPSQAVTVALSSDLQFLPDRLAPLSERAKEALAGTTAPPAVEFHYTATWTRPALTKTTVEWDPSLAERHPASWDLPSAPVNLLAESGSTVLKLAVDGEGRVTHVLVEQSSGGSEIDQIAVESARHLQFKPALPLKGAKEAPLLWGRATIFWEFTHLTE